MTEENFLYFILFTAIVLIVSFVIPLLACNLPTKEDRERKRTVKLNQTLTENGFLPEKQYCFHKLIRADDETLKDRLFMVSANSEAEAVRKILSGQGKALSEEEQEKI